VSFDKIIQTPNEAFARAAREACENAEDGPKKEAARAHLRAADIAEQGRNEAVWILEVDRAARVLK
jgi:hypothetical protein